MSTDGGIIEAVDEEATLAGAGSLHPARGELSVPQAIAAARVTVVGDGSDWALSVGGWYAAGDVTLLTGIAAGAMKTVTFGVRGGQALTFKADTAGDYRIMVEWVLGGVL